MHCLGSLLWWRLQIIPKMGCYLSRMVTCGKRLRLEALPAHMETSLAPFSRLSKVTGPSIEGIANWFSLRCHLMTIWRQRRCSTVIGRLVVILSDFSITFALPLWVRGWGINCIGSWHSFDHWNEAKLDFCIVRACLEMGLYWLGPIRLLS